MLQKEFRVITSLKILAILIGHSHLLSFDGNNHLKLNDRWRQKQSVVHCATNGYHSYQIYFEEKTTKIPFKFVDTYFPTNELLPYILKLKRTLLFGGS